MTFLKNHRRKLKHMQLSQAKYGVILLVLFCSWFSFSLSLYQPPRDPDPSGPEGMISVAISGHYFFGQNQRTAQLEEILRRFPTWAFPSSWVSTYDMYRY